MRCAEKKQNKLCLSASRKKPLPDKTTDQSAAIRSLTPRIFSRALAEGVQNATSGLPDAFDDVSQRHQPTHKRRFFFVFWDLRRRRRGLAPTRTPHQHWNVHDLKKISHTAEKKGKTPLLPAMANSHPKGGTRPPLNLLEQTIRRGRRRHKMFKLFNNRPLQRTSSLLERNKARPD